jgi:hypothetical protein
MNSFEYLIDTATQFWSIHILQNSLVLLLLLLLM